MPTVVLITAVVVRRGSGGNFMNEEYLIIKLSPHYINKYTCTCKSPLSLIHSSIVPVIHGKFIRPIYASTLSL